MFFHYSQNNSGGGFDFDEERGITHHVIIEAPDASTADAIAESKGLYFDGAGDCPCCGNRWSEAWGGDPEPAVYGRPPSKYDEGRGTRWMDPGKEIAVHYADGRIEWS